MHNLHNYDANNAYNKRGTAEIVVILYFERIIKNPPMFSTKIFFSILVRSNAAESIEMEELHDFLLEGR